MNWILRRESIYSIFCRWIYCCWLRIIVDNWSISRAKLLTSLISFSPKAMQADKTNSLFSLSEVLLHSLAWLRYILFINAFSVFLGPHTRTMRCSAFCPFTESNVIRNQPLFEVFWNPSRHIIFLLASRVCQNVSFEIAAKRHRHRIHFWRRTPDKNGFVSSILVPWGPNRQVKSEPIISWYISFFFRTLKNILIIVYPSPLDIAIIQ